MAALAGTLQATKSCTHKFKLLSSFVTIPSDGNGRDESDVESNLDSSSTVTGLAKLISDSQTRIV